MTGHFIVRVRERLGADPWELWADIRTAIEQGRTDFVEMVRRQDRHGLRLFRFRYLDGQTWVIVVNTEEMLPLSLVPDKRPK